MRKSWVILQGLLLLSVAIGRQDASEDWGYVQVRPRAHMFWWLYRSPYRVQHPSRPWPTILWLQGGPGASGVGVGNFAEVGPLDTNLKPRNFTWLHKADLLFVDNPVGTGYSFVEDSKLFARNDQEAASDLTILLEKLFNRNESLQNSPVHIIAESYGGKFAVTLALSALEAIQAGKLKLRLGGVALGDSWISPEDFVLSWGPLLKDVSRLDSNGLAKTNSVAQRIKRQIQEGEYESATVSWNELETVISSSSSNVDFYNFLLDSIADPVSSSAVESHRENAIKRYSSYLTSSNSGSLGDLDEIMNGVIRRKLKIIPKDVVWGGQADAVFGAMEGDFMKPRIEEVGELLRRGVKVTIYNGQLDVICATRGAEAWVEKLKWDGLKDFASMKRSPVFCGDDKTTKGFYKSYKNLHFYWILGAGHFVSVDQPCVTLAMVGEITESPSQ